MTTIKYIFLGLIQGFTEFLPVSSSAHLVIFQNLLQIKENQLLLDVVLHLGSLLAVVVFLSRDIKRLLNKKMLFYILLITAVTAAIVLLGQEFFEAAFNSPKTIAFALLITGLILLSTKNTQTFRRAEDLKVSDALWLGITQGLAVIPGISRSGVTVSTLLFRHVEKETAFKFSFLASILAILGALFFKIKDFNYVCAFELRHMLWGFLAAFSSGLLALRILLIVLRRAQLYLFGFYCLAFACILLILEVW